MKSGYKNSEIGVIPEDWEVKTLGELGTFRGGNGFPTKYQNNKEGDFPFFKVSDLNNVSGSYGLAFANNYINEEERRSIGAKIFPSNTIVIAKVGAAIFLERKRLLINEGCLDNNMAGLILNPIGTIDAEFILYSMLSVKLGDLVSTTALPSLNGKLLSSIKISLPPLPEQRAIAAALSDIDALIAAQDRLIAKKRDIKTAAMQALLSGKQRLPGFTGAWVERRLGELCRITIGRTPSRIVPSFWNGNIVWLSIGDMKGRIINDSKEKISQNALSFMTLIPKGTLIMSFKLSIGRVGITGVDLCSNEAICAFMEPSFNTEFMFYMISFMDISSFGVQAVKGVTLNQDSLRNIEFCLPPLDEQRAIAQVLSDMDAEIEALEAQRDKTAQIKQGMMQELLTGKTRLV